MIRCTQLLTKTRKASLHPRLYAVARCRGLHLKSALLAAGFAGDTAVVDVAG